MRNDFMNKNFRKKQFFFIYKKEFNRKAIVEKNKRISDLKT